MAGHTGQKIAYKTTIVMDNFGPTIKDIYFHI